MDLKNFTNSVTEAFSVALFWLFLKILRPFREFKKKAMAAFPVFLESNLLQ